MADSRVTIYSCKSCFVITLDRDAYDSADSLKKTKDLNATADVSEIICRLKESLTVPLQALNESSIWGIAWQYGLSNSLSHISHVRKRCTSMRSPNEDDSNSRLGDVFVAFLQARLDQRLREVSATSSSQFYDKHLTVFTTIPPKE